MLTLEQQDQHLHAGVGDPMITILITSDISGGPVAAQVPPQH